MTGVHVEPVLFTDAYEENVWSQVDTARMLPARAQQSRKDCVLAVENVVGPFCFVSYEVPDLRNQELAFWF